MDFNELDCTVLEKTFVIQMRMGASHPPPTIENSEGPLKPICARKSPIHQLKIVTASWPQSDLLYI